MADYGAEMIISHKYRFIFIKTQKTAGTSLEVFLSGVCDKKDIITPIFPHVPPHKPRNYEGLGFYNHISAREIIGKIDDDIWNEYFKFCVERNPWDKTISHYYMLSSRAVSSLSLEQYMDAKRFPSDFNKYTDDAGSLVVDKVLKYEQLEKSLNETFEELNVPFPGTLNVKAKSNYRPVNTEYRKLLEPHQVHLISEVFKREIEIFGYSY